MWEKAREARVLGAWLCGAGRRLCHSRQRGVPAVGTTCVRLLSLPAPSPRPQSVM